jgi:hypothetical protein
VRDEQRLAANPLLGHLGSLALGNCWTPNVVLASEHLTLEKLAVARNSNDPVRVPPSVSNLALLDRWIADAELAQLATLPELRALDVVVRDRPILEPPLEELELHGGDLGVVRRQLGFRQPISRFRPRRLGLHGVRDAASLVETLATWDGLDGLEELAITRCEVRDLDPLLGTRLRPRRLDLSGNPLVPAVLRALFRSPVVERLTVLKIDRCEPELFDHLSLDRLVVLDSPCERAVVPELFRHSGLPRLGRVAYDHGRKSIDCSDLAPCNRQVLRLQPGATVGGRPCNHVFSGAWRWHA